MTGERAAVTRLSGWAPPCAEVLADERASQNTPHGKMKTSLPRRKKKKNRLSLKAGLDIIATLADIVFFVARIKRECEGNARYVDLGLAFGWCVVLDWGWCVTVVWRNAGFAMMC